MKKKKVKKPYLIKQKVENKRLKKFIKERIKFFKYLRRTQFSKMKKQRKQLKEAIEILEFTLYLWKEKK